MWKCKYCGHENQFGVFCEACGKKTEPEAAKVPFPAAEPAEKTKGWRCTCGVENEDGYCFCIQCGAPRPNEENEEDATVVISAPAIGEIVLPEISDDEKLAEHEISDDDFAAITAAVLAEYSDEEQKTVQATETVKNSTDWTCAACGKTNRNGTSYCTGCGASRLEAKPAPKAAKPAAPKTRPAEYKSAQPKKTTVPKSNATEERGDRGSRNLTVLIIIMTAAVLALLAILFFVIANGGFSGNENTEKTGSASITTAVTETQVPAENTPSVTATPDPTATPEPSPTPTPSPTPAPEYLLQDSNSRYLTEADISGLSHEELCFARNEIYARHGYIFHTAEIAAYFEGKSWYHGTTSNADSVYSTFNAYEVANITLIKNYEKNHYGGSYY